LCESIREDDRSVKSMKALAPVSRTDSTPRIGIRIRGLATALTGIIAMIVVMMGVLAVGAAAAFAGFGLESFGVSMVNQDGSPDVQAGSHPVEMERSRRERQRAMRRRVAFGYEA
jgi:hypothetical protein